MDSAREGIPRPHSATDPNLRPSGPEPPDNAVVNTAGPQAIARFKWQLWKLANLVQMGREVKELGLSWIPVKVPSVRIYSY
ncbi:hypothetical protein VTI74DRAFT_7720 [Chaetomium olivicolor]